MAERPAAVLDHIERVPLPWREGEPGLTECGKPVAAVSAFLSHDEAREKFKAQGQQRAAMSTCMTCASAADRRWSASWAASPHQVVARWLNEGGRPWGHPPSGDGRIDRELRAIALLVEAHRPEFDGLMAGFGAAPSLAVRRAAKGARARGPRLFEGGARFDVPEGGGNA